MKRTVAKRDPAVLGFRLENDTEMDFKEIWGVGGVGGCSCFEYDNEHLGSIKKKCNVLANKGNC